MLWVLVDPADVLRLHSCMHCIVLLLEMGTRSDALCVWCLRSSCACSGYGLVAALTFTQLLHKAHEAAAMYWVARVAALACCRPQDAKPAVVLKDDVCSQ